ncbi:MAG TPA: hypothetical protein VFB63_17505, partial [Bryobacteraceae bacterium]|nr:hypothetical protein [Bryobacteraceae bacterium]
MKARTKASYVILVSLTAPLLLSVAGLLLAESVTQFPNSIVALLIACVSAGVLALLVFALFTTISVDRRAKTIRVPYWHVTDASFPGAWSEILWLIQLICSRSKEIEFSNVESLLVCRPTELRDYANSYKPGSVAHAIMRWQLSPIERYRISNFLFMRTYFAPDLIFAVETASNEFIFRPTYTLRISDV